MKLECLRNMQIHVFIAFLTSTMLHKSRTTSFNLNAASRLLLNMLDVGTSVTDNLSSKVESRNRFEIDWDLFLGPFALLLSALFC